MSYIHISHILTYNPVSGLQIYLINSKNIYFESHITKAKFIQNRIIYLILKIIPNIEAYQRSQYRIET